MEVQTETRAETRAETQTEMPVGGQAEMQDEMPMEAQAGTSTEVRKNAVYDFGHSAFGKMKNPGLAGLKFLLWAVLVLLSTGASAQLEDSDEDVKRGREVVQVRNRDDGRGFSRVTGKVETFSQDGLVLETSSGSKTIPAHLVMEIHYSKSEEQQLGDLHFQQKNYRDALAHYKNARIAADRRWVEVEILAQIIRCESALGFHSQAAMDFAALTELEPKLPDRIFSCIPVVWQAVPGDLQIEETARKLLRMSGKSSALSLLCGSFLLFSSDGKSIAQRMNTLAENRDQRVALLARAQTWRLNLVHVTPEIAVKWQSQLETFPVELRGGPSFILGQAHLRLKNYDSAALAFLKTALLYEENLSLKKEAFQQAVKALELGGHPEEAEKLRQEF